MGSECFKGTKRVSETKREGWMDHKGREGMKKIAEGFVRQDREGDRRRGGGRRDEKGGQAEMGGGRRKGKIRLSRTEG